MPVVTSSAFDTSQAPSTTAVLVELGVPPSVGCVVVVRSVDVALPATVTGLDRPSPPHAPRTTTATPIDKQTGSDHVLP
jgi:hypothetical protein